MSKERNFKDNMTMINSDASQQEAIQFVKNGYYTRYPVYQDNKTNVIGYLHAKDLLKDNIQDITELIHEIIYVKEADAIQNVLDKMKKQRAHIAIVHNEHGKLAGMITMEDILENIVGIIFLLLEFALSSLLLAFLIIIPLVTLVYILYCLGGGGSWLICIVAIFICIVECAVILAVREDYHMNYVAKEHIFWWKWIS